MAQPTSYLADLSMPVDIDPHFQMVDDGPLEVDSAPEGLPEHDSEAESDTGNSHEPSRSLSDEDLIEDVFENGRRYCNSVYFMPNDESEQTRLSILHQIYLIILDGKLSKAPIKPNITRVLDVGTGPGDWAFAMGEKYPDAEIIATDISVFDDDQECVPPPNVSFEIDDAEGEWVYQEPFDLIHFRALSGAFSDWPAVYQQAYTHLKPGGYIEVTDFGLATDRLHSPNSSPNSYIHIYISAIRSAAEAAGYPRNLEHMCPTALTAAGFADVQTHDVDLPVGTWPDDPLQKTLGKMSLICLLEGLEALGLRQLTRWGGWTVESVRDLCEKVKAEIVSQKGATDTVRFVVARKPLTEGGSGSKKKRKPRRRKKNNNNSNTDSNGNTESENNSNGNGHGPNGGCPDAENKDSAAIPGPNSNIPETKS